MRVAVIWGGLPRKPKKQRHYFYCLHTTTVLVTYYFYLHRDRLPIYYIRSLEDPHHSKMHQKTKLLYILIVL
jgi:hypothetical protein